jgi:hypothetical protein
MLHALPELSELPEVSPTTAVEWRASAFVHTHSEPEEEERSPLPTIALEVFPTSFAVGDTPSKCPSKVNMGSDTAKIVNRGYAVKGFIDNPDPHIARIEGPADFFDSDYVLIGRPRPSNASSSAPTAPWGRDTSLGTDEVSARGSIWGDPIGLAFGTDSLSTPDFSGGLLKGLDLAREEVSAPRVVHTRPSITGGRSTEAVEATMVRHLPALRGCFVADKASTDTINGRLAVEFEITPSGTVTHPVASHLQNVSAPLAQCFEQVVGSVRFTGSAVEPTHVSYPLHLIPATRAESSIKPSETAPKLERSETPPQPCSGNHHGHASSMRPCPR